MPTIAFTTLGCRVNQYDTDSMRGLFAAAGYEEADFSGPADVYVINTCSVTHVGEKKSRQIIRRAKRNNAGLLCSVISRCIISHSRRGCRYRDERTKAHRSSCRIVT